MREATPPHLRSLPWERNPLLLVAAPTHLALASSALPPQGENWRTYIGVGCGAAVAAILYRRLIRWVPHVSVCFRTRAAFAQLSTVRLGSVPPGALQPWGRGLGWCCPIHRTHKLHLALH